ncbi:tyrosine-type recombinase/integrase [Mycobacteroides chelonae]|uniref:tyrosine-type recombinase/integrase n=1 Tax=Mycobacteroides chelonae TaxID=1774 RepID=UPI000991AADC|nr:site-specific integrase [Mycobacteroides chelonae]
MPQLIDDDLLFEDDGTIRPTVTVNRWLRELPVSGAQSPKTWLVYARVLKSWMEFLDSHGIYLFDSRDLLRSALGVLAEHRMSGPLDARWNATTWNLHVSVLSKFYRWAMAEGIAEAEPFTYSAGARYIGPQIVAARRNNARRQTAKPHSLIKYLDEDFADLFLKVVGGMRPDGSADDTYRGREVGRNAAVTQAVISSGLRRQEFTYMLVYEVPPLPSRRTHVPVQFPLGRGLTKGAKPRTTWIDYDALAELHHYIALERSAATAGFTWAPPTHLGPALRVEDPDWQGALVDGARRPWSGLTPSERLRLVGPDGSSCVVALQSSGKPFTDWPTVFRRASERIQQAFEPRFPTVSPHRLRHTFAMRTLEWLVDGHYQRAAALALQTDNDAGLALYLLKADPLCVLRDLLGHASVTTTEIYLRRLDVLRIFHDASAKAAEQLPGSANTTIEAQWDEDRY